ncbi:MAG: chromate transporter [Mycoplasmataceae bacterium]|nr:chromate transporter [Mycoplasmataceae bacterium]
MALLISLFGILIISLIVFGGGQVFIPFFIGLWDILAKFGVQIDENTVNAIITISNATPGVISTKLAFITGYLVANGEWWGFIAMFLTYFVFVIVPIITMFFGMKFMKKLKQNEYMINVQKVLLPIVSGIMFSLAIQLLISSMLPFLTFNAMGDYFSDSSNMSDTSQFFSGWRFWVLIVWVPVTIITSFVLYTRNINVLIIIIINTVVGFLVFEPWLYEVPIAPINDFLENSKLIVFQINYI